MNAPIQPAAPVNNVITIQPVTVTAPNRDAQPNPLANLASGTTVEGFVLSRDEGNNPILRTAIGDLKVTSEVFLKTGSEVVFRVDASQASMARILTVDGMSPQDYNAQNAARGITQDTISATGLQTAAQAAQSGKPGAAAQPGPILQALILEMQPQAQAAAGNQLLAKPLPMQLLSQMALLRPGAPLRLQLLDLKLPPLPVALSALPDSPTVEHLLTSRPQSPAQTAAQAPAPSAPNAPAAGVPASPHEESAPPVRVNPQNAAPILSEPVTDETAPLQQQVQARQSLTATAFEAHDSTAALLAKSELLQPQAASAKETPHPQDSAQPRAPAPSGPQNAPIARPNVTVPTHYPNAIEAQVIGHEADGANILHTPFATLKLYTPQPLPTGTTLVVEAKPEAHAPQTAAVQPTPEETFYSSATKDWKSLDDALNWLKTNNPDVARDALQKLPVADHRLASSLLFIMAAIKGGDLGEVIGKRAVRILETGAPGLLFKLRGDMAQIQGNFVSSPLSHWSWVALPMLFGGELQQARLYVSKDAPEDEKGVANEGKGHRFILEASMSHLGDLQFDGFVKAQRQQMNKSFDLVVRSAQSLGDEVNQGIREIFESSLQISGMRGQVIFQHGSQHFVKPLAEQKTAGNGGGAKPILA